MSSRSLVACLLLCLLLSARRTWAQELPHPRAETRLAITFDDLPASVIPQYGSVRILEAIVRVLRAHRVPATTGFVIGSRLDADPDGRAALELWVRAGHLLGNHTHAHETPDRLGIAAYLADVTRLDVRLRELERSAEQHARYFRFPYLDEGASPRSSRLLARGIARLGYTNARVSLDFSDWGWADPYARCLARGDSAAIALLSRSYQESALAYLDWALLATEEVVRRPVTQVLLLHANVATAHNLDAVLSAYEQAGVQYVALADALAEPAYTADYEVSGGTVLAMASMASGRPLPAAPPHPLARLALFCR